MGSLMLIPLSRYSGTGKSFWIDYLIYIGSKLLELQTQFTQACMNLLRRTEERTTSTKMAVSNCLLFYPIIKIG
jgi:hypothetical protein